MIERKLMAHYLDAAAPGDSESFVRLGKDLEEYSATLNANVDKKQNILGETSVKISAYEKEGSVEPYYADENDPLTTRLESIIDDQLVLDACASSEVDVKLWKPVQGQTNVYEAIKYPVMIEVTSDGGDTTGYQIPFNIHYTGKGVKGNFNTSTKTFTPSVSA